MNSKYLKVLVISLCLSGLLGVMACATGGGTMAPSAPSSGAPATGDPEFWKLWESAHGLG